MRRLHCIEIADQNWCPPIFCDALTHFLQLSANRGKYYRLILQRLRQALIKARSERVIDLCSGRGGHGVPCIKKFEIQKSPKSF